MGNARFQCARTGARWIKKIKKKKKRKKREKRSSFICFPGRNIAAVAYRSAIVYKAEHLLAEAS
jgi:hypothetical protein